MHSVLLDPGFLRNELRLQAAGVVPDGLGGHTEAWSEIALLFGMVEPVSANSIVNADQAIETVTHRITIRKRNDIRSGIPLKRHDFSGLSSAKSLQGKGLLR